MAYATVGDVETLAAQRSFTATSRPSASQVVVMLEEAAAVIDSVLAARGWPTPVPASAPRALQLVRHANAVGAWWMVEVSAAASPHREEAWRAWQQQLEQLRTVELPDLPRNISQVGEARGMFPASPLFTRWDSGREVW